MNYKSFIKVPLVLIENMFFACFPSLRPMIERYIFNPLDFKNNHINYAQKKFHEFQERVDLTLDIKGKTLLELGPGGSLGFGLLTLQFGAKKYYAIDDGIHTFVGKRQLLQYSQLCGDMKNIQHYFIPQKDGVSYNPHFIQYLSINQESTYPLPDNSIDVIYSCAVLEHVHDLTLCFSEMTRVLKPNGIMYHEIDLRDHIFSQCSLWFLAINDFWFRLLFSHTGGFVNRKRKNHYQQLAKKYGFTELSTETTIAYKADTIPKRLQLLYPREDIRTLAFYTILRKKHE